MAWYELILKQRKICKSMDIMQFKMVLPKLVIAPLNLGATPSERSETILDSEKSAERISRGQLVFCLIYLAVVYARKQIKLMHQCLFG